MIICQTVSLEIRTQITDLPTAREMWKYLESATVVPVKHSSTPYTRLSLVSSRERIPSTNFTVGTVPYGVELMLSHLHITLYILLRFSSILSSALVIIATRRHIVCMSSSSSPEFEPTWAQLLHAPYVYSLDEAFTFIHVEETRLQASFTRGSAFAVSRLSLVPPAPPLLVLRLLLLLLVHPDLFHDRNGLWLITIVAFWVISSMIADRSSIDFGALLPMVILHRLHLFSYCPILLRYIL